MSRNDESEGFVSRILPGFSDWKSINVVVFEQSVEVDGLYPIIPNFPEFVKAVEIHLLRHFLKVARSFRRIIDRREREQSRCRMLGSGIFSMTYTGLYVT